MEHNNQKQYGLIRLSKGKASASASIIKKASIFDESDDDSDSDSAAIPQFHSNVRKQTEAKISKAIEEDPNIFQYDEVFDQMKSESANKHKLSQPAVEKKSRYIGNMLKHKDMREKEQELRSERKIQKEREMEGDEFKDKESFVTNAYKEKLEELKKAQADFDEKEKIEDILDVTKQTDINSFYRSIFRNDLFKADNTSNDNENTEPVKFNKKSNVQKKTNLRERNADEDEDNEESDTDNRETPAEEVVNESNSEPPLQQKIETEKVQPSTEPIEAKPAAPESSIQEPSKGTETLEPTSTESASNEVKESEVLPAKKPKMDRAEIIKKMFTKRTVDKVLEEARSRYLERKALRQIS